MNIQKLISTLQDLAESYPNVEVEVAHHPSSPFEYNANDIVAIEMEGEEGEEELSEVVVVWFVDNLLKVE
jgi:hypothetical protein